MTGRDKIIVALDLPDRESCRRMVESLQPDLRFVKIGSVLFSSEGPPILSWAASLGLRIFLDLKFHDIPNTVGGAVASACRLAPLTFLTLHASGGTEMIRAARESAERAGGRDRPKILAVTVLTSLAAAQLNEIGFSGADPKETVERLARLAVAAGADGIVCSPKEVGHLRKLLPAEVTLVIPGIRAGGSSKDDQERTSGAAEAVRAGADYLVVGRPVTGASDPKAAFLALAKEAEDA